MQSKLGRTESTCSTDTDSAYTERGPASATKRRRRWPYYSAAGVALVAIAGASTYTWLNVTSTVADTGVTSCTDVPASAPGGASASATLTGVCATMSALTRAWDANDAEAYGALFTADATYTTWVGTVYAGRADIVNSHRALFDGPLAGTRLEDRYLSLRVLTDDVAVLLTRGDTYDDEPPESPSKVQSYTMVREGDTWRVAAFHNTQRGKVMERIQFLWYPGTRPAAE
ncbi:SgcJ/EcaC family oxidoreductase [Nocardia cyriacigeorgica]|nr:SgcJ/EcaC family oxidoreductase [Nocardia cyriacigeorgica]MBF6100209.1 SgcJ/EcaC family oxidoreductase [Nocardia cyriacigeorgica]MBF6398777.1 SgcJ/EcaC family oxidoreductase [Nocardia cyriacigeorgica]MBF6403709.1 SgcJ/EcaC family oxidoreductase [Nocardia cyriacigeorgica]